MKFGTEANMVIDKLASVLGSTSGEIVNEYTQAVIARGIGNLVVLLGLILMGWGSFELSRIAAKRIEEENKRNSFEILGGLMMLGAILGGIASIVGGFCCVMTPLSILAHPKRRQSRYS